MCYSKKCSTTPFGTSINKIQETPTSQQFQIKTKTNSEDRGHNSIWHCRSQGITVHVVILTWSHGLKALAKQDEGKLNIFFAISPSNTAQAQQPWLRSLYKLMPLATKNKNIWYIWYGCEHGNFPLRLLCCWLLLQWVLSRPKQCKPARGAHWVDTMPPTSWIQLCVLPHASSPAKWSTSYPVSLHDQQSNRQ